jgi:hypothetical protein
VLVFTVGAPVSCSKRQKSGFRGAEANRRGGIATTMEFLVVRTAEQLDLQGIAPDQSDSRLPFWPGLRFLHTELRSSLPRPPTRALVVGDWLEYLTPSPTIERYSHLESFKNACTPQGTAPHRTHRLAARGRIGRERRHHFDSEPRAGCRGCAWDSQQRIARGGCGFRRLRTGIPIDCGQ